MHRDKQREAARAGTFIELIAAIGDTDTTDTEIIIEDTVDTTKATLLKQDCGVDRTNHSYMP